MTHTVHLHIGEPKSGTTYLQGVLHENRAELRERGLLIPGNREQIRASQDAIRGKADGTMWNELVASLLTSDVPHSLISMETLCRAEGSAVRRAVSALGNADVRVYITARDLVRTLPAQWQQSTQHHKTWSWQEYFGAVVESRKGHPGFRNFWSQHDLEAILRRWSAAVSSDHITVITLPPAGADPEILWRRFSEAIGIASGGYRMVNPANESLGASSAELLRRLNVSLGDSTINEKKYNTVVRSLLARQILAGRRALETKVALPKTAGPWATREAERIIDAVGSSGVKVIGDLSELQPRLDDLESQVDAATSEEVVEAAVGALRGLVEELARGR